MLRDGEIMKLPFAHCQELLMFIRNDMQTWKHIFYVVRVSLTPLPNKNFIAEILQTMLAVCETDSFILAPSELVTVRLAFKNFLLSAATCKLLCSNAV